MQRGEPLRTIPGVHAGIMCNESLPRPLINALHMLPTQPCAFHSVAVRLKCHATDFSRHVRTHRAADGHHKIVRSLDQVLCS